MSRRADADRIITARLAGTASRFAATEPLDVSAALADLRDIADGRRDLLAEVAGRILRGAQDKLDVGRWPQKALEAGCCIERL